MKPKPKKERVISVRIAEDLVCDLEKSGRPEQRKLSAQVRKVLMDWQAGQVKKKAGGVSGD